MSDLYGGVITSIRYAPYAEIEVANCDFPLCGSVMEVTTHRGVYAFHHDRTCCEKVELGDVTGGIDDIIGKPLLLVEESISVEDRDMSRLRWTFYKFATVKGYVTMRWDGKSNGCYSEEVDLSLIEDGDSINWVNGCKELA